MAIRTLKASEVTFTISCEPEYVSIAGNASAIDDEADAATEAWIQEQLDSGNDWAWCCVVVRATWKGFCGQDTLGCCSYESEASFTQPGGYYDDMKQAAMDNLNAEIASAGAKLDSIRV